MFGLIGVVAEGSNMKDQFMGKPILPLTLSLYHLTLLIHLIRLNQEIFLEQMVLVLLKVLLDKRIYFG